MPAPASPRSQRRPRRPVRVGLVAALATASAIAVLPALSTPAVAATAAEPSDLTVVQANLLSPQTYQRFQRDAAEVLREAPDLITYNEVAFRSDEFLAPQGYELWRSTKDRFTKATPVAWRTDRYTALAKGTSMISDWRGRPPGRSIEIGRRQANWVTLESNQGRVISLVSVHIAPRSTGMPDLNRRSVRRLGALVGQLDDRGPVLVGGDFNVPVGGSRYPADLFAAAGMRSTYELLGTRFGTSDHGDGRATIDYVFVNGQDQLEVDRHYPLELNSDHDAVVAKLSWTTDPPSASTTVANDPTGTYGERRAVASAVVETIKGASSGDLVQVATRGTDLRPVVRALTRAADRGVRVQLTTRGPRLSAAERQLAERLRGGNWVEHCQRECAREWEAAHPPSMLLVSDAKNRPTKLVTVSRRLRQAVITQRTRATIDTGSVSLEEARGAFAG
ncbi:endonuclease/exonuclease/phosphatase family protein [Nocardioides euryhalodurans]|uniref:Endonuclease/exonuclease/phosphatase domain-containing protein n=1 Tax=Nocardioides euryhalodurans TaxID=2518370 RepID=A0A4P7GJ86_9ACTN|nr:endonuclease/exonuclease/phosphatase family protein [Nocardioides euryhalodurans]QBR91943.1 hypothetical protein EXE57_06375 [Nocardioides euryhalodurans]